MSRSAPLGTARRRLDLETPTTHNPCAVNRFYSSSFDRNVIVPESPIPDRSSYNDNSMAWQPGQALPIEHPSVSLEPARGTPSGYDLETMLQSMQYAIDAKLEEVKEKLTELESKVKNIEEKQREHSSASHSSSSADTPSDHQRKRRNPSELQVGYH